MSPSLRDPEAPPLRVCLVGPAPDMVGGQAAQLRRLVARFAGNASLEVSSLAVNPPMPGALAALQRVKYLRTLVNSLAYGFALLGRVPRVDVVHAFSASYWSFLLAPVPAMLAARLFGKGVILNYHSGEADDHLARWHGVVPLMRLAHLIVVPSDYLVDVFARHGLAAQVVPNFIELDHLPHRVRDPLRPAFLSNRALAPDYNVGCVLRAFARIQARLPEARLAVAGDGPLRPALEREARSRGLRNVTFHGGLPPERMAALYDASDVYLNAPDVDNMPNSILEAAACGLPIVSSDAGGIPYIVRHGESALLCPRNDDAALAAAALRLFGEPGLAAHLAGEARAQVLRRYTWPAAEAGWIAAYHVAAGFIAPRARGH